MRTFSSAVHRLAAAAAIVALAAACGGGGDGGGSTSPTPQPKPSPDAATVQATTANAFNPKSVTVAPGGKVHYSFSSVQHNVTFTPATGVPADIPNTSSATVDRVFSTAGTFNYHCTIHPGMTGSVVVATTTTSNGSGGGGCDPYYGC